MFYFYKYDLNDGIWFKNSNHVTPCTKNIAHHAMRYILKNMVQYSEYKQIR